MRRWLCLVLVLLAVVACPAAPVRVTDARGTAVTLPAVPQRIISLSPGTTEMLFAVGAGDAVVGDTRFCDYPPAAKARAKVGDSRVDYEKVLALRPDLVVADASANEAALPRLTQLHLPVFAVAPTSLPGVEQTLLSLGRVTGHAAGASAAVAAMRRKEHQAAAIVERDATHRPRVLIAVGTGPLWTAGRGTFLDDLVTRAGGDNVASSVRGFAPYSKEAVLAHPPDEIMGGPLVQRGFRADPVLRTLAAVRAGRFFYVTDPNLAERPGPRLADGLLQVTRALHPGVR